MEDEQRSVIGKADVGSITVNCAFLLVYATEDGGEIRKLSSLGSHTTVSTAGHIFMAANTALESARWIEALDRLISWGWVKQVGNIQSYRYWL